jgi:glycosyltransferase involved in cell wall biosynthesis
MKFTIIIATNNAADSLPKTLDSIISQSYSNFEIIIVDNNSTDGTSALVKKYGKTLKDKIFWISEPDRGIYDAMNKGIIHANGEWLYFLGSGDTLHDKEVLSYVVKTINSKRLSVVYGSIKWGDTDIISHGRFTAPKLIELNICHQAIFCKKSVFDKIGKFDLKYSICADYVFNMKWFNDKSIKHKYMDRIIAVYDLTGISSVQKDKVFMADKKNLIREFFPAYIIVLGNLRINFFRMVRAFGMISRGDLANLRAKISEVLGKEEI